MDYEPYDSSGTDDDLPPSHQNRMSRGARVAGNGRPAVVTVPYPRMYNDTDMENQIRQLEQEAYISVLRAFKAQADAITWEKESLITELRKELRLSNEEHRELLGRVNADDVIRKIREWRQAGGLQSSMLANNQVAQDPNPSPTLSASRKKQKINQALPSQSFGGPTPFHPPPLLAPNQSSSAKRGPSIGPKGKKHKPGQILPGSSTKTMQYSSLPTGRGQGVNRVSSGTILGELNESKTFDSLIGRRVKTRWPDDNNFYEAVITDFNPVEGRHALVYDIGTQNETWEWVNLSEISPEDIKWDGKDPGISQRGGYGCGSVPHLNRSVGHEGLPGGGRGRGITKGQFKKEFTPSQNGIAKKAPEDIQILHTDTLIKEVERIFSASHPDPIEMNKAKKVLKEHEQALIDAIQRLADISGDDSGRQYQPMDRL